MEIEDIIGILVEIPHLSPPSARIATNYGIIFDARYQGCNSYDLDECLQFHGRDLSKIAFLKSKEDFNAFYHECEDGRPWGKSGSFAVLDALHLAGVEIGWVEETYK